MGKRTDLNKASSCWRDRSSNGFENSSDFDSCKDISEEDSPFRGFEKTPRVLLSKINIEPFLKNGAAFKYSLFRNGGKTSPTDVCKTLPQLVANCSVQLLREDLELLKDEVLKNCRLNTKSRLENSNMPLLRCKICEKAYSSKKKLQNHLGNKHMLVYGNGYCQKPQKRVSFSDHVIVHEIREYHKCRKCTKIFEDYKCLKTHMKQMHKKRKCYICNYCSKNFLDRMFFKVHIRLHCDSCGLLLPDRKSYLLHRRESCRIVKKYECKTCHDIFFRYMDLKDHSYDHIEKVFVCDTCKEQFHNRCSIAHHILFLHSKRRPKELYTFRNLGNERLYLCNFCETSSIDRNIIENHISVLPDLNYRKHRGYKDYYYCDQCLKKFDTETDMLQHKWTHYLNTCDNSQVQQKSVIPKPKHEEIESHEEFKSMQREQTVPEQHFIRKFNINGKLPMLMQPKIVLEKLNLGDAQKTVEFEDSNNINTDNDDVCIISDDDEEKQAASPKPGINGMNGTVDLNSKDIVIDAAGDQGDGGHEVFTITKKAIVDQKSKKTLISRYQCRKCHKYYSNNYCLNRHIAQVHEGHSNLRCKMCEETFVWPSLLRTHKCLRMNIPEMPFDDARPEIQFDNYRDVDTNGLDDLMNISESDDYMNSVDFEIPAPIVQLTEYENCVVDTGTSFNHQNTNYSMPVSNGYKIVMHEVPIEF